MLKKLIFRLNTDYGSDEHTIVILNTDIKIKTLRNKKNWYLE